MTFKTLISGITAALLISAGPLVAEGSETATVAPEAPATAETCTFFSCAFANLRIGNPIDPSTWWDGAEAAGHDHELVKVNPMDPAFWMMIPNPETHSRLHATLTNPAGWAQFMTPEMVTRMMSTDNLANLVNPDTYEVLLDPQTYAYWMQPGAYTHVINTDHYAELINPQAYMTLFSDVAGAWMGLADG